MAQNPAFESALMLFLIGLPFVEMGVEDAFYHGGPRWDINLDTPAFINATQDILRDAERYIHISTFVIRYLSARHNIFLVV
jgi:hypothetical protein